MSNEEKFDVKKFARGLNPFDPLLWVKGFVHTFRALLIVGIVIGMIFGVGYLRGYKNRPVQVDMADTTITLLDPEGKEHILEIQDGIMKFDGRNVSVADVPSLKPYGVELRPKVAAGITTSGTATAGGALEVGHLYNFNLDLLALYQFLGIGVSYDIRVDKPIKVDGSSIGLGIGRDFSTNENAAVVYYAIEF